MGFHRLPVKDPRTVARDIPGICDLLFPQLLPAIITYLNRQAKNISNCEPVSTTLIGKTSADAAMLFEVANARAEQILSHKINEDWGSCLDVALKRQSKYFDAEPPERLTEYDLDVVRATSNNLITLFRELGTLKKLTVEPSPAIPGYRWISKGYGDYSVGDILIEVKCTSKNFGSADYRQLLIYWLLSFAGSIEDKSKEWKTGLLVNPRLNKYIEIEFNQLINFSAAGRSKLEILELFESIVSDYDGKLSIG